MELGGHDIFPRHNRGELSIVLRGSGDVLSIFRLSIVRVNKIEVAVVRQSGHKGVRRTPTDLVPAHLRHANIFSPEWQYPARKPAKAGRVLLSARFKQH